MSATSMPGWLREANRATPERQASRLGTRVLTDTLTNEERMRLVKAGTPVYGPEERILELCEQAAIRSDARIC